MTKCHSLIPGFSKLGIGHRSKPTNVMQCVIKIVIIYDDIVLFYRRHCVASGHSLAAAPTKCGFCSDWSKDSGTAGGESSVRQPSLIQGRGICILYSTISCIIGADR